MIKTRSKLSGEQVKDNEFIQTAAFLLHTTLLRSMMFVQETL